MPQSNSGRSMWKYAGWGFQMVATILICMWLGNLLDDALTLQKPWFSLSGGLLAVIGVLIQLIKNMSK